MKPKSLIYIMVLLMLGFGGCQSNRNQSDYCTVKGTIKGLPDGTKLELEDEFNRFAVVGEGVVKDGTFEIHPTVSAPTHVFLYTQEEGLQLKDFILEPGTVLVEVDADDEADMETGATGTPSNNIRRRVMEYDLRGDKDSADALRAEVMGAEQTGALALATINEWCKSSFQALGVLDRLTPELAGLEYVAGLRVELAQRMKTEPRTEGSDMVPLYIDMNYPDVNGDSISLGAVVKDAANRYVLVDFWATWCPGCLAAMPRLKEIYATYHDKGLGVYGISVDAQFERWKDYVERNKLPWVNVCDGSGGRKNSKAWHDYALSGIPKTLLIDCESGEVIARDGLAGIEGMLAELLR